MFSFHKPKIYRSNLGCCICKAKSSSSRFTDSKKYENEFEHCFRLKEKRSGEICNACVLLVKRWKKLSHENRLTKHWHHVVDARAGPGTKLTGNRRLTSSSSQQRSSLSSSDDLNDNSTAKSNRITNKGSDTLPLSSSQVNSQSSSSKGRSLSKVCAIDTNVSTFTFGEPIVNVNRTRSYMSNEPSYYPSNKQSSSFKPQSALNSSAFESVIKRFRQRQQQEYLQAQQRQMSRQQRVQQRKSSKRNSGEHLIASTSSSGKCEPDKLNSIYQIITKRVQRYSSTDNSYGVTNVLDSSIWRREKICCGVIFRGLYNEIAIVPRLIKPCHCRLSASQREFELTKDEQEELANQATENNEDALRIKDGEGDERKTPSRATKSGSISSCDSNTSGCGSMEEVNNATVPVNSANESRRVGKTTPESPRKRQRLNDGEQLNVRSPGGSSSGNSSSRPAICDDDEDEEEEEGLILDDVSILEVGDASNYDSSNDTTSSSVESLASAECVGKESDTVVFG